MKTRDQLFLACLDRSLILALFIGWVSFEIMILRLHSDGLGSGCFGATGSIRVFQACRLLLQGRMRYHPLREKSFISVTLLYQSPNERL